MLNLYTLMNPIRYVFFSVSSLHADLYCELDKTLLLSLTAIHVYCK